MAALSAQFDITPVMGSCQPKTDRPIVIDLFCGLGGWTDGFLAENYRCIGFDIERHDYGTGGYPGELVLQDVHTIHGRQFKDAACIVSSPPCQEFSYMSMPWKRAKQIAAALRGARDPRDLRVPEVPFPEGYSGSRTIAQLTALFDACFRIQREAIEATAVDCPACCGLGPRHSGHVCPRCNGKACITRHIPMVVENVKGAQPWVGKAQANYGSFYLWGDVRSVGGRIVAAHRVEFGAAAVKAYRAQKIEGYSDPRRNGGKGAHLTCQIENDRRGQKNSGGSWFNIAHNAESGLANNPVSVPAGRKVPMNFHEHEKTGKPGRSFQSAAVESTGAKVPVCPVCCAELIQRGLAVAGEVCQGCRFGGGMESQKQPVWFNDDKRRATKCGGDWFGPGEDCSLMRSMSSKSSARKAASAQIAKIPFDLACYLARSFRPATS